MEARKAIICGLRAQGFIPNMNEKLKVTMEARKSIICGLPAKGFIQQLHQHPREEDIIEISSDDDVIELTNVQYRRSIPKYLIRVEVDEENIEPDFRRLLANLRKEEIRLRNEKLSAVMKRIKREEGESSRGIKREEGESSRGKSKRRD